MHSSATAPSKDSKSGSRIPFPRITFRSGQKSARVLLVDDELVVGEALKMLFTRQGHKVTHCSSPDAALQLCRNSPSGYDVLITDQSMPGMTGYDLAVSVHEISPSMPIFIQTGHISSVLKKAAGKHGIQHVYQKPVSSKTLCEKVLRSLEDPAD